MCPGVGSHFDNMKNISWHFRSLHWNSPSTFEPFESFRYPLKWMVKLDIYCNSIGIEALDWTITAVQNLGVVINPVGIRKKLFEASIWIGIVLECCYIHWFDNDAITKMLRVAGTFHRILQRVELWANWHRMKFMFELKRKIHRNNSLSILNSPLNRHQHDWVWSEAFRPHLIWKYQMILSLWSIEWLMKFLNKRFLSKTSHFRYFQLTFLPLSMFWFGYKRDTSNRCLNSVPEIHLWHNWCEMNGHRPNISILYLRHSISNNMDRVQS